MLGGPRVQFLALQIANFIKKDHKTSTASDMPCEDKYKVQTFLNISTNQTYGEILFYFIIQSHIQKDLCMRGCYKMFVCTSYYTDQHCSELNDTSYLQDDKCVGVKQHVHICITQL